MYLYFFGSRLHHYVLIFVTIDLILIDGKCKAGGVGWSDQAKLSKSEIHRVREPVHTQVHYFTQSVHVRCTLYTKSSALSIACRHYFYAWSISIRSMFVTTSVYISIIEYTGSLFFIYYSIIKKTKSQVQTKCLTFKNKNVSNFI